MSIQDARRRNLRAHIDAVYGGLVPLSLDSTGPARIAVRETVAVYGLQLSRGAAMLGQEWEKLEPELQRAVQTMIEALVAKQKRTERRRPDRPDDSPQRLRP